MASYNSIPLEIRNAIEGLPEDLLGRSGSIFYSGIEAFSRKSPLYILGLNPGGAPTKAATATISSYLKRFKMLEAPWSEYSDESWEDAEPGTWGLQPRILHLLAHLDFDARFVPSSNVVFVKSRNENELALEKAELLKACWPVHQAVIESLGITTTLCFGSTAGSWVRGQLNANELTDSFTEQNRRGWTSRTHQDASGRQVISVTHPSRADWRNPLADPTDLVGRALERCGRN